MIECFRNWQALTLKWKIFNSIKKFLCISLVLQTKKNLPCNGCLCVFRYFDNVHSKLKKKNLNLYEGNFENVLGMIYYLSIIHLNSAIARFSCLIIVLIFFLISFPLTLRVGIYRSLFCYIYTFQKLRK